MKCDKKNRDNLSQQNSVKWCPCGKKEVGRREVCSLICFSLINWSHIPQPPEECQQGFRPAGTDYISTVVHIVSRVTKTTTHTASLFWTLMGKFSLLSIKSLIISSYRNIIQVLDNLLLSSLSLTLTTNNQPQRTWPSELKSIFLHFLALCPWASDWIHL